MSDLTALHAQAKRLIMTLREGLERLETMETGQRPGDPSRLAKDLLGKLQELQRSSQQMDGMWRMQLIRETAAARDVWKRKVEHIAEETDAIRVSLDRYGGREARRLVERREREELLGAAEAGRRAQNEAEEEAYARGMMSRSKGMLEEMYEQGSAILVGMAGNRERLKSAHRRALDVINGVGLGDSLLRMIERRQRLDIWITYGGMAVLTIVAFLVMWFAWFR